MQDFFHKRSANLHLIIFFIIKWQLYDFLSFLPWSVIVIQSAAYLKQMVLIF